MTQLSIIVPVYNAFQTLDRCVNSILSQTWDDFELILINDGSSDDSDILCDQFAAKDVRVHAFHQENRGLPAARNAGVKAAKGTFYLFVDSDDYLAPRCCELLMNAQQQTEADLVISSYVNIFPSRQKKCSFGDYVFSSVSQLEERYTVLTLKYCYSCAWGKLYRATLFDKFNESCRFGEDVELNMRYLPRCHTIRILDTCLYYYTHLNSSAMTKRFDKNKFTYALSIYQLRIAFSKKYFSHCYIPRAENALLAGDTIRTIQRLVLFGGLSYSQEREQIHIWLNHPQVQAAAKHMFFSSPLYFAVWICVRFRLKRLLQMIFRMQKAIKK